MSTIAFGSPLSVLNSVNRPNASVAVLADGTFLVVQEANLDVAGSIQRYSAAGEPIGNLIAIAGPGPSIGFNGIEPLSGGGFAILFNQTGGFGREKAAYVRFYTADGAPTSGFILAVPPLVGDHDQREFYMVATSDNGVFIEYSTEINGAQDVHGRFVFADGALGPDINLAAGTESAPGVRGGTPTTYDGTTGTQISGEPVRLINGAIITPYLDQNYVVDSGNPFFPNSFNAYDEVSAKIVTPDGVSAEIRVGGPEYLSRTALTPSRVDAVALAGGGFAVVWREDTYDSSNGTHIGHRMARIFNMSGNAVTSSFELFQQGGDTVITDQHLAPLADGGFAVLYQEKTDATGQDVKLAIVGGNGALREILTVRGGTGDQYAIDVAAAPDGSLLVSTSSGPGASGQAYLTQRYVIGAEGEAVLTGDADANTLAGGGANDWLAGEDGDDTLSGQGGIDRLYGGDGSDALFGGDGNDVMDDGAEDTSSIRDFLFGGVGDDTYNVWDTLTSAQDIVYEGADVSGAQGGVSDVDTIISHGEFFRDFYSVAESLRIANDANAQFATTYLVGGASSNAQIFGNGGSNIISTYGGSKVVDAGGGTDAISFSRYDLDASFEGVNTLVSRAGTGIDYLYDFQSGVDKVDLRSFNFGISGQQVLDQGVNVLGSDPNSSADDYVYFYLTNAGGVDNYVAFVGLTTAQLQANDFITA